jgi:hypothetical protein
MAGQLHYFTEDLTGLAAGTLLALLLLVLPGFGLVRLGDRFALSPNEPFTRTCWSLVLGPVLLPAVDALLLRYFGMAAVLVPHLAFAALGAPRGFAVLKRISFGWWLTLLAAWAVVAWANVDFDWNGKLHQSLSVFDTVKHGAVTAAIATRGVPFGDPFFARPGITGYYFYFYIGPALIRWLAFPLVDNRMAFAAATFVTLIGFPAMLLLIADRAGLIAQGMRKRFVRTVTFLCCVQGFDVLAGIVIWIGTGLTLKQLETWSPELRWALTSILWVPHHLTALIAVFAGALTLSARRGTPLQRSAIAALAFTTAFGCSVWVAFGAAIVLSVWWVVERDRSAAMPFWLLPLSGVIAGVLLVPQFHDLIIGRTAGPFPLALTVHGVGPDPGEPHSLFDVLKRLVLLPFAYLIQFGVFAIGAFFFWRRGGFAAMRATPVGRLLLCAFPVALLLGSFVRSTIIYNDFSWRTLWFAEVPALLWTASVLSQRTRAIWRSPVWSGAIALGVAATTWDLVGLRFVRPPYFNTLLTVVNAHPEVDYDLRATYRWIDRTLPPGLIVQHNPADLRGIDFGLYGDRPVAIADYQARLFGADQRDVLRRGAMLKTIYIQPLPLAEVRQRALANGARAILLTSADPLWQRGNGPPSTWSCTYRAPHSCVMLLEGHR